MKKTSYAIRGAVQVPFDSIKEINSAVKELMEKIYSLNKISEEDVAFVLFSQTSDLKSKNAASAFRETGMASKTPIFCVGEAEIAGMMRHVIRVLVYIGHEEITPACPVYINGAEKLRPDFSK